MQINSVHFEKLLRLLFMPLLDTANRNTTVASFSEIPKSGKKTSVFLM